MPKKIDSGQTASQNLRMKFGHMLLVNIVEIGGNRSLPVINGNDTNDGFNLHLRQGIQRW